MIFFAILLYASTTFTLHLVNKPVIPPSGLLVDESQMAGTVASSSASTSTQSSPYQYGSNLYLTSKLNYINILIKHIDATIHI